MEDWDIQNLNLPQGSGHTLPYPPFVAFPLTPSAVTLRHGNSQLENLLWQNYLPPPTPGQPSQTIRRGVLGAVSYQEASWPVSASGLQIGQIPEAFDRPNSWDRFREFAEDEIHACFSRPDSVSK